MKAGQAPRDSGGEDPALFARLRDLCERASKRNLPCYSSFLTEREQAAAQNLPALFGVCCRLEGGHPDAERRIFCALPACFPWPAADFPVVPLTIRLPKGYTVGHRDVLGTLLSLGLAREVLGDLLIGEQEIVVFALRPAADLILAELSRIGGVGVHCAGGAPAQLPALYRLERRSAVISSLRLDCVVAALAKVSRNESARLIAQGLVFRNARTDLSGARELAVGDTVSVRKIGKFRLVAVGPVTRKGRLTLEYDQYC